MNWRLALATSILAIAATPAHATTLDDAIAAALQHAPQADAAAAENDAAQARVIQAEAEALPTATLTGTIGLGRLDPQNYFGLAAANVVPRAAQVVIEQPLFTGGRIGAAIVEARAGSAAARAEEEIVRDRIVLATVETYGLVLTTGQMISLYNQLFIQMTELQRQARLKFETGESPRTEMLQATARRAEAEAALESARAASASARARFTNLTGLVPDDLAPLPPNPELPASLDEALDLARNDNPAIVQAQAALEGAEAAARGAKAERLPSVGAFAEASSVRDQFFPDYRADAIAIGLRARWQFYSGGRVPAKVAETDSSVRAAEARLRAAKASVEEEAISAFQEARSAMLVEAASAQQALAAGSVRDNVRLEVRVGMKPQIDLLDAEREATAAAVSVTMAQRGRIVAAYRLRAVLGW